MNVEGCAELSRALSAFLETDDPIEGEYDLEISSPGIDRPLTRLADFARWAGHEAKIELHAPLAGVGEAGSDSVPASDQPNKARKRFRGVIGLDGNEVTVATQGSTIRFPFKAILEAKLVLTDKLISGASARAGATTNKEAGE
jgi:ribosome maturation factor RimP